MQVEHTALPGVFVVTPKVFTDPRGWFMESYSFRELSRQLGVELRCVQETPLRSTRKGVLRGIHFQEQPFAQSKLVRCTVGRVMDYAVDLRRDSPTFRQWVCVELDADSHEQLFIPKGFGHAVVSLSEISELQYMVDAPYSPEHDRAVRWDDPELDVRWPFAADELISSEKDRAAPYLKDIDSGR